MKQLQRFLGGLLILISAQQVLAQYAPLHWNSTGVRIRQGWHIEWQRTGEEDDAGNSIFAWSDTREGDRDLYAQKMSPTGQKLWGDEGALIIGYNRRQEDPSVIATGFGDYIFIWNDFRDDTTKGDLYAQKVDSDGNQLWNQDGVLLSTGDFDTPAVFRIVPDGTGGALVLWNDLRNGNSDVYATRIDSDGNIPGNWPLNGMEVTVEPAAQDQLTVDTDGAGGALIAWQDNQTENNIYIQRVSIDGTLWNGGTPIAVCTAPETQLQPKLCPDGSGGAYVIWTDKRDDFNGDIYFQHVLSDGSLVFPEQNGKILINDPTASKQQIQGRIVSDGAGNAIIIWLDARDSLPGQDIFDIYAQKVDSTGNLLWNSTGNPVCIDPSVQESARLNADGAGGAVIVWMDERDGNENPFTNVFAQRINANGEVAWATDGVPVCEADGKQESPLVRAFPDYSLIAWGDFRSGSNGIWYQKLNNNGNPQLAVDGDTLAWGISGDAVGIDLVKSTPDKLFIFFEDHRFSGDHATAYVQLINMVGEVQLAPDGQEICPEPIYTTQKGQEEINACSDGGNGAIAVWRDYRDSNIAYQIYAQRIIPDGQLHWGNGGVQVSPYDRQQVEPQIVSDGSGGGIVAWTEATPSWDSKVNAAKVDQNGNTIWSVEVADHLGQDDRLESIVPDGSGGVYISYFHFIQSTSDYNLYAQHVDASGNLLWIDGVTICDLPQIQLNSKALSLESDGVIFAWEDKRDTLDYDIYAQRFSFDGDTMWQDDGVEVIRETNDQLGPDLALDTNGDIIITWDDFRPPGPDTTLTDIYVQKLDMNGQRLFPESGLPVSTEQLDQKNPRVLSDDNGGCYIVWVDFRSGSFPDLYGTHLDEDGQLSTESVPGWNYDWIEDGNIICDAFQWQENHQLTDDYDGGAVVVWEDKRSSGKEEVKNIYSQRLNGSVVGVDPSEPREIQPSSFELYQPYPNPFNPIVKIRFDVKQAGVVKLTVYDLQGRLVETLKDEWHSSGAKEITWKPENLASGIYFVNLEAKDHKSQKRVILLK